MGVVVRRNLKGDALMQTIRADPVEVVFLHLEDRDALVGGALNGFGEALV